MRVLNTQRGRHTEITHFYPRFINLEKRSILLQTLFYQGQLNCIDNVQCKTRRRIAFMERLGQIHTRRKYDPHNPDHLYNAISSFSLSPPSDLQFHADGTEYLQGAAHTNKTGHPLLLVCRLIYMCDWNLIMGKSCKSYAVDAVLKRKDKGLSDHLC